MDATRTEVLVRWMIRLDMPAVLRIERDSFDDPWTEEEFLGYLRERITIGQVAERGEIVVGYVVYRLHRARIEVVNLAVDPRERRRGVGTRLVGGLVQKLSAGRRRSITAKVRERNVAAQLFLRSCGFRAVCVLHGAYDAGEDGYLMRFEAGGLGTAEG